MSKLERGMQAERELSDAGKVIEGGWQCFRITVISAGCPESLLEDMRLAFFSGAQHVHAALIECHDDGHEPSDADLKRMEDIDSELKDFYEKVLLESSKPMGSA